MIAVVHQVGDVAETDQAAETRAAKTAATTLAEVRAVDVVGEAADVGVMVSLRKRSQQLPIR